MLRRLKHTVAVSLVIILFLPMTIKLLDTLFHHHDHFVCTAKNEKHFHKHHSKCPLADFELSFFPLVKQEQTTQKCSYCVEIKEIYNQVFFCNKSKYSFLLRAPPVFTNS